MQVSAEEHRVPEDQNIPKVAGLLYTKFKVSELPAFFYRHMAGMVIEEPPSNGSEMYQLIGPFVQNGNHISEKEAHQLCAEVNQALVDQGLIVLENKYNLGAERLEEDVVLGEVTLLRDKEGFENAYSSQKARNANEEMEKGGERKKFKGKDKEGDKAKEQMERHIQAMGAQLKKIPPVTVKHDRSSGAKSQDLILENISVIVGGRELLQDTHLKLAYGRKYGLIGRNGIGKTSLMNQLARQEFDKMPTHLQILLVEQEIHGGEKSVIQMVLETDTEREKLLQEEEDLSNSPDNSKKIADRI